MGRIKKSFFFRGKIEVLYLFRKEEKYYFEA